MPDEFVPEEGAPGVVAPPAAGARWLSGPPTTVRLLWLPLPELLLEPAAEPEPLLPEPEPLAGGGSTVVTGIRGALVGVDGGELDDDWLEEEDWVDEELPGLVLWLEPVPEDCPLVWLSPGEAVWLSGCDCTVV